MPPLRKLNACVSVAATVVAPETAKPMKAPPNVPPLVSEEVTITSALPDAGMVTVAAGPAVVRSVYVVDAVPCDVATVLLADPAVPDGPVAPVLPVAPVAPAGPWTP